MVAYLGIVTMALANVFQVVGCAGMPPGPAATLLLARSNDRHCSRRRDPREALPPLGIVGLGCVLDGLVLQARAVSGARREGAEPQPACEPGCRGTWRSSKHRGSPQQWTSAAGLAFR